MRDEYQDLSPEVRKAVDDVIKASRAAGKIIHQPYGNSETVYAYPHPGGGYSWGWEGGPHGFNLKRGIRE